MSKNIMCVNDISHRCMWALSGAEMERNEQKSGWAGAERWADIPENAWAGAEHGVRGAA